MQELRDIKDIVEVHEHSLETLIAVVFITLLIFGLLFYLYKNRRIRRKKPTKRELALKRLQNIDFDDVKSAVYTFSVDGSIFTDQENIDQFKKIDALLERYKYQKDVPNIDESTKEMMKQFIRKLK